MLHPLEKLQQFLLALDGSAGGAVWCGGEPRKRLKFIHSDTGKLRRSCLPTTCWAFEEMPRGSILWLVLHLLFLVEEPQQFLIVPPGNSSWCSTPSLVGGCSKLVGAPSDPMDPRLSHSSPIPLLHFTERPSCSLSGV